MIDELIKRVLVTMLKTRVEQYKSRDGKIVCAIREFLKSIGNELDDVVEVYVGVFGELNYIDSSDIEEKDAGDSLVDLLREESDWIEVNRDSISGGSNMVASMVDRVTLSYVKLIYNLELQ